MMLPINKKEFYAIEDKKRIQQLLKRTREKKQCKDKETMRTQIKEIVTGARVKKKNPTVRNFCLGTSTTGSGEKRRKKPEVHMRSEEKQNREQAPLLQESKFEAVRLAIEKEKLQKLIRKIKDVDNKPGMNTRGLTQKNQVKKSKVQLPPIHIQNQKIPISTPKILRAITKKLGM